MNTNIYSKSESYARPDGQVKRYHSALITEVGEAGRSRLPKFVRAEDFDRVITERDQLQLDRNAQDEENDRLRQTLKKYEYHVCMTGTQDEIDEFAELTESKA